MLIIFSITIVWLIGWFFGLSKVFKKAGLESSKAWIPFYNTYLMVEACGLKKHWFWLQFIPFAGPFFTLWINIMFTMHFKRFSFSDHTLATVLPFYFYPKLARDATQKFYGVKALDGYVKSVSREWVDAIIFAVIAATIIRLFTFEMYVIPSESMERTLLVHDFLAVNKLAYGPRIPQTPLFFPFVHNLMPFSESVPSYLKWIQLDYCRLPAYSSVKRNDVVVFNFPYGDTVINLPDFGSKNPYYDVLRIRYDGNRNELLNDYPILVHPIDKTDNYVKRCVAVPGDTLEIIDGSLKINGRPSKYPTGSQTQYFVKTNGAAPLDYDFFLNELGIDLENVSSDDVQVYNQNAGLYRINLTTENVDKLREQSSILNITPYIDNEVGRTFPFDYDNYNWTIDNYGPVIIPKKGQAINLTAKNYALYERLIKVYELHSLEMIDSVTFMIDGQKTNTFTPRYNYYWMMGDNRHQSQDSRYWGFVPETHIVGRASLIWYSYNKSLFDIRWNRLFRLIE
ncbi:MAG: signal peptidase I [Alphaproteobacteria bacterium]|nr:signal peptidase I [Alphaproteobacteria bacterium]